MTKDEFQLPLVDLNAEIASLMQQFGRWRILLAIAKAYVRIKSRPPDAAQREADLRKDMGLPDKVADPITLWRGMR